MRIFRITFLMISFLIIFGGLTLLMVYYQIVRGPEIAEKAVAMRSQQIELKEFHRGVIWDRNRLPLTGTRTASALYCFPQEAFHQKNASGEKTDISDSAINHLAEQLTALVPQLNIKQVCKDIKNCLQTGEAFVRLATDLTADQVALLQSQDIPGVVVAPVQKRYSDDGFLAHIIGTVENGKAARGLSGIEKVYEDILRNSASSLELVSVQDARGEVINGLMYKIRQEQDQARGSVVLTIDKRVQSSLEEIMDHRVKKGAVVVMDIETRQILAMASRPTFNPYQVSQVIDTDQESSLMNRALTSYHPGSLFKLLVAAAALDKGLVDFTTPFHCSGSYRVNEQVEISCWKEEGHGDLYFEEALALSCNTAFIEVAQLAGRKTLLEYAKKMHLTDESLAGYGMYKAGSGISINPGPAALGNAALGQQGVLLTPLQLTSLIAIIADDGLWIQPSLVLYYIDNDGQQHYQSRQTQEQVLSAYTARKLQHMLSLTMEKGTGRSAAIADVSMAGKTGTSQTGQINEREEEILNTWFGGYFPTENPRWAVVVMVEEGASGAESAAPVFKDLAKSLIQLYSAAG